MKKVLGTISAFFGFLLLPTDSIRVACAGLGLFVIGLVLTDVLDVDYENRKKEGKS